MERKLLDRLDMVQAQGKQDKRLPVLFTPDMIALIHTLVKYRDEVGIKAENRYLFATAAEGHLDKLRDEADSMALVPVDMPTEVVVNDNTRSVNHPDDI